MQKTIIYLDPFIAPQASWVTVNSSNHIVQTVMQGNLYDIPASENNDIIVIVPAQDILLTAAQLPKLNASRLQQALPFALEEHLIDDVSQLHFAIGEYQTDGTYPAAVVTQQKWMNG